MSRWPRMVVLGVAVHVIQRGNHRQHIFFATGDDGAMLQRTLRADTLARFAIKISDPNGAYLVVPEKSILRGGNRESLV